MKSALSERNRYKRSRAASRSESLYDVGFFASVTCRVPDGVALQERHTGSRP